MLKKRHGFSARAPFKRFKNVIQGSFGFSGTTGNLKTLAVFTERFFDNVAGNKPGGYGMKKLLMLTIATLLVITALPSLAKVAISDEDLNRVTAEEGVSVQFVNMTVGGTTAIDELSWGDGNGFGSTYTSAGFVGAKNVIITGSLTVISGTANIDVGSSGSQTRVALNLPTVTLGTMNVDTVMKLSGSQDLSGGKELGILDLRGFSTSVTGTVEVFAHN